MPVDDLELRTLLWPHLRFEWQTCELHDGQNTLPAQSLHHLHPFFQLIYANPAPGRAVDVAEQSAVAEPGEVHEPSKLPRLPGGRR